MMATLKSGKEVRGANNGRGLEVAAEDFNLGQEFDEEDDECRHLHVYVAHGDFEFVCSDEELTIEEIEEAGEALSLECLKWDVEAAKLREKLLEPTGDRLLAEKQAGKSDNDTASKDVVRAILPPFGSVPCNSSWAAVKAEIARRRALRQASGMA